MGDTMNTIKYLEFTKYIEFRYKDEKECKDIASASGRLTDYVRTAREIIPITATVQFQIQFDFFEFIFWHFFAKNKM